MLERAAAVSAYGARAYNQKINIMQNITNTLSAKLQNKRPLYQAMAGIVKEAIYENFRTEGRRLSGGSWAPLAKSTLKQKERKGFASILRNTGRLQNSISINVDDNGLTAFSSLPYAGIQNSGGRAPLKKYSKSFVKKMTSRKTGINIPARPYLELNKSDMERIYEAVRRWVRE